MCDNALPTGNKCCTLNIMNGQELKERRIKLKIIRRHFCNLLGISVDKLYRMEIGKTSIPPNLEEVVKNIEEKLNKPENKRA